MGVIVKGMQHLLGLSAMRNTTLRKPQFIHFKSTFLYGIHHVVRKSDFVKLKSKEFQVNPGFGTFKTFANVDCVVKPCCPQAYPDADRAFVDVYGKESSPPEDITIELTGETKDCLTINAFPELSPVYIEIQLPVKYDLDINLQEEANIHVSGMEGEENHIKTQLGDIDLKGVKAHNIHITTRKGNITSEGTLQGNIFISAKKTYFTAKKLQGMALTIDAEHLDTSINSSYMTQGEIRAQSGHINVRNLHGCTDFVLRKGQVSINGLSGQIAGFIGKGNIDVHVTDISGNSTLHLNDGTMNISMLEEPRHNLEVTAPSLNVDGKLKSRGSMVEEKPQKFNYIEADSVDTNTLIVNVIKGSVNIDCQSWFSSLGIQNST